MDESKLTGGGIRRFGKLKIEIDDVFAVVAGFVLRA
jgi:hypothetical protein